MIRHFFMMLVQAVWGLPQTLMGLALYLYWRPRSRRHFRFRGAIVTEWGIGGGISLGLFVFVPKKAARYMRNGRELTEDECRRAILVHEYGHCIQSLLLGPLYLLLVGLPSYLWANLPALRKWRRSKSMSYYAVYPENWANACGEWAAKEASPRMALPVRRTAA